MAPVAKEFDKIIKDGRERKKNEALASKIFSKDRRQSAPSKLKAGSGPSLASRVGVRKVRLHDETTHEKGKARIKRSF
ncbi:hypothetical protein NLG97_g9992 [Lecanicillium saksenae]|uniref:Uncharacterized protein n=1 Tax=Lecanicillium saksenae TaxID=468837 RepID=A0ACC1QEF9_9HYPO|nr:hypothetical protein NLG97_g9992 [Lecanicillium saksenae]